MSNQIPTGWQELKIEKLSSKVGSGVTPRGGLLYTLLMELSLFAVKMYIFQGLS